MSETLDSSDPAGDAIPRCVVVDDNDDFACSLSELVIGFGYDVRVALSGQHAEHVISLHQPGCVLLDLGMPGLSGSELGSRLRATYGNGMVLVAMTGMAQINIALSPELACFGHCLQKPLDLTRLQDILHH